MRCAVNPEAWGNIGARQRDNRARSVRMVRPGVVIALVALAAGSAGAAPAWQKPRLGTPYGINGHDEIWSAPNPESQELADLGIGWVRVDFTWSAIEPAPG